MKYGALLNASEAIREFYGDRRAARSGVPLINHIFEGTTILNALGATEETLAAFRIHPMLQDDRELRDSLKQGSVFRRYEQDPVVVALAMEYRVVANAYLSKHYASRDDVIKLSVVPQVNQMLIADKVQNRKDFERYHAETHPNSPVLTRYFHNWLWALGVDEDRYKELASLIA